MKDDLVVVAGGGGFIGGHLVGRLLAEGDFPRRIRVLIRTLGRIVEDRLHVHHGACGQTLRLGQRVLRLPEEVEAGNRDQVDA